MGGSITVPLTPCLTGLDWSVLQKNVSCQTVNSKSVKQEVNGTVILPPLVFPGQLYKKLYYGNVMEHCKLSLKMKLR